MLLCTIEPRLYLWYYAGSGSYENKKMIQAPKGFVLTQRDGECAGASEQSKATEMPHPAFFSWCVNRFSVQLPPLDL